MIRLYEEIPLSLCLRLHGFTINEAISLGIITDIGDENGNFIYTDSENENIKYVIIQGYCVKCSENLINSCFLDDDENFGNLSLFRYEKNGKEYFVVGIPKSLRLDMTSGKVDIKKLILK